MYGFIRIDSRETKENNIIRNSYSFSQDSVPFHKIKKAKLSKQNKKDKQISSIMPSKYDLEQDESWEETDDEEVDEEEELNEEGEYDDESSLSSSSLDSDSDSVSSTSSSDEEDESDDDSDKDGCDEYTDSDGNNISSDDEIVRLCVLNNNKYNCIIFVSNNTFISF